MISKKLKDEIWDYCRMNDITDVNNFIERMVQQGYLIEKYGNSPVDLTPETIEKIVEVEVEVIKEVEKIVEVVVDKIVEVIKEVPVEVIKEVTNDSEIQKYIDEIDMWKKESMSVKKASKSWKEQVLVLEEKIKIISKELEEEKRKPKREKREIKAPESTTHRSSINWVSQNNRDTDNLYDD